MGRSRVVRAASLLAACALAAGCATPLGPPRELDLSRAAIVFDADRPVPVPENAPSKELAVGAGAAGGMGTGVLVAAVGCLGTGPFYALCLSVALPATTVAGGLGGAVVGAIVADSDAAGETAQGLLKTELATASYPTLLAEHVQQQARERFSVELPLLAATAPPNGGANAIDASTRAWLIEPSLTLVGSGRAAPGQPLALRVEGHLKLRRRDQPAVVYEASAVVTSDVALTSAEWAADGGEPLRSGLDRSLRLLADKLLSDLLRSGVPSLAPASLDQRGVW